MQIDRPIASAIILFAALLLAFFVVMPQYNDFGSLQTQLGEKKAEFNAEYDYYSQIAKTYDDIQTHQDDIAKIDDALPTDPDLGKTIYFLQEQAAQSGLIIKDLFLAKSSPQVSGTSDTTGTVNDLIFSMDLLGGYSSLNSFINTLQQSSRIFEVSSITFGSDSSPTSSTTTQFQSADSFSFNMQIITHSY